MKVIHHSKMHGRLVTKVYLCDQGWKALSTRTKTPDTTKLFNFEVSAGRGKEAKTLLVLDNYGDETIPSALFDRLFCMGVFDFNLAVDKTDGTLFTAQFAQEGRTYVMTVAALMANGKSLQLPKKFVGRVNELKSKKRPYYLSCQEGTLWGFIDREAGFNDIRENLVVDLHFDRRRLQVWGDSYREVSPWGNVK